MTFKRLALGGILVAAVGGGLASARVALFAVSAFKPGSRDEAIVEVHKGQSHSDIAKALQSAGVIGDPANFIFVGKVLRDWRKIKAGEYKFSPAMNPIQIFSVLGSGVSVPHPITVREGENMYEIAKDMDAKGLATSATVLALCKNPALIQSLGLDSKEVHSLEGYLYPDTYFFNHSQAPEDMIRQMVRHFRQVWGAKEDARARELGMSVNQVMTLASIIEKETGAPQERPLISSVFYNRLRKKMRLQSDPTTIYGMWEHYDGNIRRQDLLAKNEFNTYFIPALPIGPISNPGKESIQAALYPTQSDYLFFVSHNDGTHEFTRSLGEHNMAVRKFQLDPKAREGKSWRDLKKKAQKSPATSPT